MPSAVSIVSSPGAQGLPQQPPVGIYSASAEVWSPGCAHHRGDKLAGSVSGSAHPSILQPFPRLLARLQAKAINGAVINIPPPGFVTS